MGDSADIPLYDVLKIFRFGRKHMACLTRVSREASTRGIIGGSPAANGSTDGGLVRRASPALPGAFVEGQQVEEVVGIVTIEDVLEELLQVGSRHQHRTCRPLLCALAMTRAPVLLPWVERQNPTSTILLDPFLRNNNGKSANAGAAHSPQPVCVWLPALQAEIVDETDRFEDNLQTVPVPSLPQARWLPRLPPQAGPPAATSSVCSCTADAPTCPPPPPRPACRNR